MNTSGSVYKYNNEPLPDIVSHLTRQLADLKDNVAKIEIALDYLKANPGAAVLKNLGY